MFVTRKVCYQLNYNTIYLLNLNLILKCKQVVAALSYETTHSHLTIDFSNVRISIWSSLTRKTFTGFQSSWRRASNAVHPKQHQPVKVTLLMQVIYRGIRTTSESSKLRFVTSKHWEIDMCWNKACRKIHDCFGWNAEDDTSLPIK